MICVPLVGKLPHSPLLLVRYCHAGAVKHEALVTLTVKSALSPRQTLWAEGFPIAGRPFITVSVASLLGISPLAAGNRQRYCTRWATALLEIVREKVEFSSPALYAEGGVMFTSAQAASALARYCHL